MEQKDIDLEKIQKLIEIMKANDLVEMELKQGEEKILLKRAQPQQPVITSIPPIMQGAANEPAVKQHPENKEETTALGKNDGLIEIKSPIVGTFYATPSPDSESFVEINSHVEPQTVVCIIEAMKVMNEIKAGTSGIITEILAKSGQAIEYGQVLFKVKPD